MERWRAVVPIVLALVIAVAASVLIYKWMKKQTAPKKVAEKAETMQVAVAEVEIPAGTKLKSEMMKTVYFLEDSLPQGYFSAPEKAAGRIVVTPIRRTELILESRLAPKDVKRGGMAAILKPGKRAVSVAGNKVLGLSGLINPGDRVDILLTPSDPKTQTKLNKTVFENVLVLATGTQLSRNAEGKPSPVDNYTLEVTPEQGERLVLAASQGKIHFALRSVLDKETVLTTGATQPEILASYRPVEPTKRAKSKLAIKEGGRHTRVRRGISAGKGFTLEVIKGLNRSVQNF